jgi:hypothetical protein
MGLSHQLGVHRDFLRSGRAVVLLSALVVTVIAATAGFTIRHNCQSAVSEHQRSMKSMGVVLAEQTGRYVQVIDLIVLAVKSQIATLGITTPAEFDRRLATQGVQAGLAERLKNVPQVDAITLVDADGLILNLSRGWPVRSANVSSRDYDTHFKELDDPGMRRW